MFFPLRILRISVLSGLLGTLALIAGCASDRPSGGSRPGQVSQAEQQASSGNYGAAAAAYMQQAQQARGAKASEYLIQASHYYALAGQTEQAKQTAARINPATLVPPQDTAWRILQAHLTLLRGDPQQAQQMLSGISSVPRSSAAWIWLVRAGAAEALGDPMRALQARIELDRALPGDARKRDNEDRLWRDLQGLSDRQLDAMRQPAVNATLAGWASLALVYRGAPPGAAGLRQAIRSWQASHATHPAAKGFATRLGEQPQQAMLQPRQVAVLLPDQGRYAAPADAVRDGIVAAWEQQAGVNRPELRFYGVPEAAQQVVGVYQGALADGADAVIGPLRKEAVAALVNSGAITVPTLALNHLAEQPANPAALPTDLYQFGLSPEDEAAAAAKQARMDGLSRAVVLAPVGPKGDRIVAAFQRGLEENDGVLLEERRYNTSHESPFSDPIKAVLNLDASRNRRNKLENMLGENLEFEPTRRSDVDYVFLYARPVSARQIIPQLAFFHAAKLPIYATADAFDGRPNRDVQGLVYPTTPWQSAPSVEHSEMRRLLQQYRGDQFARFDRLYALGIDAMDVLPRLPQLRGFNRQSVPGASGRLSVNPAGMVVRDPLWARVNHGTIDVYTAPAMMPAPDAAQPIPAGIPGDAATDSGADGGSVLEGTALPRRIEIHAIDPNAPASAPGAYAPVR